MWILVFITLVGPFEVGKVEILEIFDSRQECVDRHTESASYAPQNTSLGCLPLDKVRRTNG